jgi:PRTRC genetic system protein C
MALEVTNLTRKFMFKNKELADPNPELSVEEVLKQYVPKHEELTTATISGPEIKDDKAVYTFNTTVGTKG